MVDEAQRALELLRIGSGLPEAQFREGQEQAIEHVVEGRGGAQRLLRDDTSYDNYFLTSELEVELAKRLGLEIALHFERNDFTTDIPLDARRGEHENQFQGDIVLVYELTEIVDLTAGFQGAYRKESFEDALRNVNAWLGVRAAF